MSMNEAAAAACVVVSLTLAFGAQKGVPQV
jgi:hypothetical protein